MSHMVPISSSIFSPFFYDTILCLYLGMMLTSPSTKCRSLCGLHDIRKSLVSVVVCSGIENMSSLTL